MLPARVVPRRRWALSLGLKVAGWYRDGLSMALDALSDLGLTLERLQWKLPGGATGWFEGKSL